MAIYKHNDDPNVVVRYLRMVYNPVGFKKGYNAILAFISLGYLFGFCLSQVRIFDVSGYWVHEAAAPGEGWAYETKGLLYKVSITMHIVIVIPAGLLATLQFIPIIRYKALVFHRINGYVVMLLMVIFSVTGIIISKVSFGGDFATQAFAGCFGLSVIGSITLAYINIKRLQIEQHRAWMMRAWVYSASIITLRLVQIIAANIMGRIPDSYRMIPCEQLASVGAAEAYVSCAADPQGWAAVKMDFDGNGVAEIMAVLQGTFAGAGIVAYLLHALGIELYLHLTPAEAERLRKVSHERQLERGFKRPGSAGLTSDRLGDAEWTALTKEGGEVTK
ncbi:hypothetical protein Q7P37_007214 [Cladosporium fusiforme]